MADGMSEDSAELARIRRRQYLFDQTIQIRALCISAETAVIPHLSLFFCRFKNPYLLGRSGKRKAIIGSIL